MRFAALQCGKADNQGPKGLNEIARDRKVVDQESVIYVADHILLFRLANANAP